MKLAQSIKSFVFAAGVLGALLGGQVSVYASSSGTGGGEDIIVFDIIDSATEARSGGGEDIIVFDIIDSVTEARSGGGEDIIVFDIIDSVVEDDPDEGDEAAAASSVGQSEYKYVPVRP